jgi:hypothetical protein
LYNLQCEAIEWAIKEELKIGFPEFNNNGLPFYIPENTVMGRIYQIRDELRKNHK